MSDNMNLKYKYYTGNPDTAEYIHSDQRCEVMGVAWGDMTENAAIRAIEDPDDLDACPRCCDL